MIGGKWYDMVVGVDIHWVLIPAPPSPVPIPTPLPHPFTGLVFDPVGLAVTTAMAAGMSAVTGNPFGGPVLVNGMTCAATGTEATNKLVMPHFPMPPGVAWAPVPAGLKPPIPGKKPDPGIPSPIPTNDAVMITGSKMVYFNGTNACRLGDLAMSCGEPVRLPSSTMIAIPMGLPVLVGGPPALDFIAALTSTVRSQWVSQKLHKVTKAKPGSWRSKAICFFTGHPVDVVSGMVMTEALDFECPGPIPFNLARTYYSRAKYRGPLGQGWNHSYDQFLRQEEERWVYHDGDGRELYFYLEPGETRTRNDSERMDFHLLENGAVIHTADRQRLVFGKQDAITDRWPLQRIEDRFGNVVRLQYDDRGYLTTIFDSAKREIGFHHDEQGLLRRVTAPHPDNPAARIDVARYEFNEAGDLVTVYDALNRPCHYAYKHHLLVQETDRNGFSFYFAYDGIDADAKCVRTWGDEGIYDHLLTYDPINGITVVEDSYGHATAYYGNDGGLVEKIIDPLGNETQFQWDEDFRKTCETDATGAQIQWQYDARGNCIQITQPDGGTTRNQYDDRDRLCAVTDPMGSTWRYEYDGLDRMIRRTDPGGASVKCSYQGHRLTNVVDPADHRLTYTYDHQDNLIALATADGALHRREYDAWGRAKRLQLPSGAEQHRSYDLANNLLTAQLPDGNTVEQRFDGMDNPIFFRDSSHEVISAYGCWNRLTRREQNGASIQLAYDKEGRLLSITNQAGHVYQFAYDAAGQLRSELDFEGCEHRYDLDGAGRLATYHRPDQSRISYQYDPVGRLTNIDFGDGMHESFSYDLLGHLCTATNEAAQVALNWDASGHVVREARDDHWIESHYDARGHRIGLHSSLGAQQQLRYDANGDVASYQWGSDETAATITIERDRGGLEVKRRLPGDVAVTWQRDEFGRPVTQRWLRGDGLIRERNYRWGHGTQLRGLEDSRLGAMQFVHNQLDRLVEASWQSGHVDLRLPDAVGNLFRQRDQKDREYSPSGRLLRSAEYAYEYDALGRLIRKSNERETWHYRWDAADRLRVVEKPDSCEIRFEYDALGRRIRKQVGKQTIHWLWDGDVILHEWRTQAAPPPVTTAHAGAVDVHPENKHRIDAHPPNGPPTDLVTWYFDAQAHIPVARESQGKLETVVTDHLGTPLALFDQHGKETWSADLDTSGRVIQHQGDRNRCPFRFPGQYEDTETGLYYNRHRYYDPEAGGYISPDPLGIEPSLGVYQYVKDPLTECDPLGLGNCGDFEVPKKVPGVADGKFAKWFDNLTPNQFDEVWKVTKLRNSIKRRLRHPGGQHEWLMVARANVFKRWGKKAQDVWDLRTPTKDVKFKNPSGAHGKGGSTTAHNEILKIIDNASDYNSFKAGLKQWADKRLVGGSSALPPGLQ